METTAEMIVHPAGGHFSQGEERHPERRFAIATVAPFAREHSHKKVEGDRPRKFRRAAKAALFAVESSRQLIETAGQRVGAGFCRGRGARAGKLLKLLDDLRAVRDDVLAICFPRFRNPLEDRRETGPPLPIFGRIIRAAEKRLQVRGEKDAHRPSAATRRRLNECHVNAIDIGSLFAIDFDVHEVRVHDLRDLFVFKRFVRHHVAPVACRIADREKDRLLLRARFFESLFAPRIPLHRVVHVLQKVGRLFVRQRVFRRSGFHGRCGLSSVRTDRCEEESRADQAGRNVREWH